MELSRIYRHRFSDADAAAMDAVWRVLVRHFFQRWVPADGAVLDIGAGLCGFVNNVAAARRVAFDANPAVAGHCADGVAFVQGTDLAAADLGAPFDAAFVSNFLEHLDGPDHVLALLAAARGKLKADGRLLILQPNFALIGARYFDFIDHKTVLTDHSLVEALEITGYRVEVMKRRFLPYTSKSALPRAPWMVRLYLMMPPAQWLLGGQTFVVARPAD